MKIFVLEGPNDVVFIESILNHHFKKTNIPKASNNKINLRKSIKTLMSKLRDSKEYNYLKNEFGIIIYGDNGKDNVISKVIPRLCYDLIGKNPPKQIEFLVVLDEDGEPLSNIMVRIKEEIINRNMPDSEVLDINSSNIKVQFNSDDSYWIYIRVCLIPHSLEYQIIHKAIETKISLSKRQQRKLLNSKEDEALREIANLLDVSKEELFRLSVFDGWFLGSEWYDGIIQKIGNFIS
jgi:hypothetical protein